MMRIAFIGYCYLLHVNLPQPPILINCDKEAVIQYQSIVKDKFVIEEVNDIEGFLYSPTKEEYPPLVQRYIAAIKLRSTCKFDYGVIETTDV